MSEEYECNKGDCMCSNKKREGLKSKQTCHSEPAYRQAGSA